MTTFVSRMFHYLSSLFFWPAVWLIRRIYLRSIFVKSLGQVRSQLKKDLPVLVIANHVSWWDGIFIRKVMHKLRPQVHFSFPLIEREFRKQPFLRLLGAEPLDPDSRSSTLRLLKKVSQLHDLHQEKLCLMYFPQGKIYPSGRRPLGFKRGVELVGRQMLPFQMIGIGIHIEPLNHLRPQAFVTLEHWGEINELDIQRDLLFTQKIEDKLRSQLDLFLGELRHHGEDLPKLINSKESSWQILA